MENDPITAMQIFIPILIFGFISHMFWMAVYRQKYKGKFNVTLDTSEKYNVITDLGTTVIDYGLKQVSLPGRPRKIISLEEIRGIRFSHDADWALATEKAFGINVAEPSARFSSLDRMHWYTIKLVTSENDEIPMFIVGEYEPKAFVPAWVISIEIYLLERLGLMPDVNAYAREKLNILVAKLSTDNQKLALL